MTPGILMLIGASAIVVGILGLVINFLLFMKNVSNLDSSSLGVRFVAHIVCALLYGGGALALLGGFIWFLVALIVGAPAPHAA